MRAQCIRLVITAVLTFIALGLEARTIVPLDGEWEIGEGGMDAPPETFDHRVPVPGLVDMAQPAFPEVGVASSRRKAFWYRRTFQVTGAIPPIAELKIRKAAYGSRVFLNGVSLGEHLPSFTPGHFDVRTAIRGDGQTNILLVRVGAFRDSVPRSIPSGWDFEKTFYTPGIFDSVELLLADAPRVVRIQTAPQITSKSVRTMTWMTAADAPATGKLELVVREARSGKVVGRGSPTGAFPLRPREECAIELVIPVEPCHLWTPEDPFMYEIEATTGADALKTRFGMREFRFDPQTGRAMLNGRPRFLRGSNVTLYRFFEDAERGDKPWRTNWVRHLHERFREMHWDSLRYCIGFPPDFWYDIADEQGFLIQDEFPLWHLGEWPKELKSDQLAIEYAEWMRERWNHPSVVIWDAQNETRTEETGKAIQAVRHLDLSDRPWDNGWGPPQAPGDSFESHPYLFSNPTFQLSGLARVSGRPQGNPVPNSKTNAIILNEYGWLWLNRDGTPTTLTKKVYENLLGTHVTSAQRRELYARYLAALTEFWRGHRECVGVLHFCGLGYSRPDGQTSDHFTDLEQLTFEPNFLRYVRDAFAPVGLMINEWADELNGGELRTIPVFVINDLDKPWQGSARLRLFSGLNRPSDERHIVHESFLTCSVSPLERRQVSFAVPVPTESGRYQIEVALIHPDTELVRSYRDFSILSPAERRARDGIAMGKAASASSSTTKDGVFYPAFQAVDGQTSTRWSSDFRDPQWLAIDFREPQSISRVQLLWENAYAKAYTIEVSDDGEQWREVYATRSGDGGVDDVRFTPVRARWVRMRGTQRATPFGYSLWEMRVFNEASD